MEANTSPVASKMLTIKQAAREAGVTESAIRNAIYRGKLTVVEMYDKQLIERPVFEAYRQNTKMGRPAGSRNQPEASEAGSEGVGTMGEETQA